ncbi:MAG TPA: gamma-glutamyl-gamma-aminobutyrate hydrolase family protein [Solirubrobacteraceae bacterium]
MPGDGVPTPSAGGRPVIGITSYVAQAQWGLWDLPAALVPLSYAAAVAATGGRPVLLPPMVDGIGETLAAVDGLIFCGGPDIDPAVYGQRAAAATAALSPERDPAELSLLRAALADDVPLLAICRGMQLLNVVRGGTLVQHLPDVVGHEGHRTRPGSFDVHEVQLAPETRIGTVLGPRVTGCSGHHQGIDVIGDGLTAAGWAFDGSVEALEDPGRRFALGVLWHPEEGEDRRLFVALVQAAARSRQVKARSREPSPSADRAPSP